MADVDVQKADSEEMMKWFGDKGRFDVVTTNAEGKSRALEFVVVECEMVPRKATDSLTTPPEIVFRAKYVGKREPTDAELPDQELGLPTLEDTGFAFDMVVKGHGETDATGSD